MAFAQQNGFGTSSSMSWNPGQTRSSAAAAAADPMPTTDSLLSRFGLQAGDNVVGRFLVGEGSDAHWFRGVLSYNTSADPRFEHCVYKILYEDGEVLFYDVDYMRRQLETGWIKKYGT